MSDITIPYDTTFLLLLKCYRLLEEAYIYEETEYPPITGFDFDLYRRFLYRRTVFNEQQASRVHRGS
jgi:hypothetical protein